jgi:O-antigen/teichoic acid export membrane protein
MVGVVFTLIFDLTLIPIFGSIGAAAASSISYLSIFISILLLSSKKLQFPIYNPLVLSNKDFNFFINR